MSQVDSATYECGSCGGRFGVEDVYDQQGAVICRRCFAAQQSAAAPASSAAAGAPASTAGRPKPGAAGRGGSVVRLVAINVVVLAVVVGGMWWYGRSRTGELDQLAAAARSARDAGDERAALSRYKALFDEAQRTKVPKGAIPALDAAMQEWHDLAVSVVAAGDAARKAGDWRTASLKYQEVASLAGAGLLPETAAADVERAAGAWERMYAEPVDRARGAAKLGDFARASEQYRQAYTMARDNLFPKSAGPTVQDGIREWESLLRATIADARAKLKAGDTAGAREAYAKLLGERGKPVPNTIAPDLQTALTEASRVAANPAP